MTEWLWWLVCAVAGVGWAEVVLIAALMAAQVIGERRKGGPKDGTRK